MMNSLVTYLLLLSIFLNIGAYGKSSSEEIDDYIQSLEYSRDEVLNYKGDRIYQVPLLQGSMDDRKCFTVIKNEKKSTFNGKSDIGVVSSNEHVTYPGALLLANQRLMDNSPDMLVVDRANLTFTVNLPGLGHEGHFTAKPTFADYQANKEKTLTSWFNHFSNDREVAANFQSETAFAYSKEYLRVKFGLEFRYMLIESNIDFEAMKNQEKLIVIYRFKQIFYTVSVPPLQKPSDLFTPWVTLADVKGKTDGTRPPVIVDSVSYGRSIFVKLETSSTDHEAKSYLKSKKAFVFNSENESEVRRKFKDINIQVFVLGGSTDHVQLINTNSFQAVNNVLIRYSKFSRTNLGYPISYSTRFVKDNSRAVVNMATDYVETSSMTKCKGSIKIVHKGWFVMRWEITWKEVSYDEYGHKQTNEVSWHRNGKDISAPFSEEIELPGNAEDIRVFAKEATGLLWEWWRTVIDKRDVPLIDFREFYVWGTTLDPKHRIEPPI